MTVPAPHYALRDLLLDPAPRYGLQQQLAHSRRLRGRIDVIELKHADVGLSAVDACVRAQVLK
jgi:hypothetical protein